MRTDLLGDHGQHFHIDAVELIKTRPGAGLGEASEQTAQRNDIHTLRAVKDNDVLSKGLAQVLDRLSFT